MLRKRSLLQISLDCEHVCGYAILTLHILHWKFVLLSNASVCIAMDFLCNKQSFHLGPSNFTSFFPRKKIDPFISSFINTCLFTCDAGIENPSDTMHERTNKANETESRAMWFYFNIWIFNQFYDHNLTVVPRNHVACGSTNEHNNWKTPKELPIFFIIKYGK